MLVPKAKSQIKAMAFNIRYDNPDDGKNQWQHRKNAVLRLIDYYSPDFLGIQEGEHHQVEFINKNLLEYQYVGVGRDDGKQEGEYTAIYYDTTRFVLVETKTFWLSETPDTVSVGWDASMERICTCGSFIDKSAEDSIHIFNCHFDHIGKVSREMSAKLVLDKIRASGLLDQRLIVMGDFNAEPQSAPIQLFKKTLDDGAEISDKSLYGPAGTFTGFDSQSVPERRIDYIFTRGLEILSYTHVDNDRGNNLKVSDHLPVLIEAK